MKTDSTTATLTQNSSAGTVTLGSFIHAGSGNSVFQINPANGLIFNNGGSGAIISNASSGTGTTRIAIGSGTVTLNDNLLISNTSSSTNTQSISITAALGGTGDLTISNASNSLSSGVINLGGTNTFTGSVNILKGAVLVAAQTGGLGNSANLVTLGSAGNGSASLIATSNNSPSTLANNIVVSAGTGGTLLLGSNVSGTANSTFSGTILLNGNLSIMSERTGIYEVRFTNAISGTGDLRTEGSGNIALRGVNTYSGNTILNGGAFTFADNAGLKFVINGSGLNNKVSGTANQVANFDGDFTFDLTNAGTTVGDTWTIVDIATLSETFSSTFTVVNFTADGGGVLWTKDIDGSKYYRFSEATGLLQVVPEPSTWLLLAGGLMVTAGLRRCRNRRER